MPSPLISPRAGELTPMMPPGLASVLRPEVPSLTEEIIAAIRHEIPEYARPMDGPYGEALHIGVHQALTTFVDLVADHTSSCQKRNDVCRMLGEVEAREGRSIATLELAYRIGARVAWQRVMAVGERATLPSPTISRLADAVLGYTDELARLSVQAYREAQSRAPDECQRRRRRLLRMILEQPQAPATAIEEAACLARWILPERITVVLAEPGTRYEPAAPADDVLAEPTGSELRLLVPGELDSGRLGELERALSGGRAVVGLPVLLAGAADSQRWARQALDLASTGILGDAKLIRCADHLLTLLLLADRALVEQAAASLLAPLADLSPTRRGKVTETLEALIKTSGTATDMAAHLDVHPQTIRYRNRQLRQIFGSALADPDARLTIEFVLRAKRLLERSAGDGPAIPDPAASPVTRSPESRAGATAARGASPASR